LTGKGLSNGTPGFQFAFVQVLPEAGVVEPELLRSTLRRRATVGDQAVHRKPEKPDMTAGAVAPPHLHPSAKLVLYSLWMEHCGADLVETVPSILELSH